MNKIALIVALLLASFLPKDLQGQALTQPLYTISIQARLPPIEICTSTAINNIWIFNDLDAGTITIYHCDVDSPGVQGYQWVEDWTSGPSGGGAPCTITPNSLQFDNAGAFGCTTPFTYATNTITGAAAGLVNLTAMSAVNAGKLLPVQPGGTATANGAVAYDSSANMLHAAQSSADAKIPQFTITPSNGDCVVWSVSGSTYKLGDSPCAASTPPCTTTGTSLQYDNAGAFGCTAEFTYASSTITASSAGLVNLTAMSTLNAGKVLPVQAGATATANGAIAYDSTNNMIHAAQAGADAKIPQFTITPTNSDCVSWVVSGSNYKLGDAGSPCGGGASVPNNPCDILFVGVGPVLAVDNGLCWVTENKLLTIGDDTNTVDASNVLTLQAGKGNTIGVKSGTLQSSDFQIGVSNSIPASAATNTGAGTQAFQIGVSNTLTGSNSSDAFMVGEQNITAGGGSQYYSLGQTNSITGVHQSYYAIGSANGITSSASQTFADFYAFGVGNTIATASNNSTTMFAIGDGNSIATTSNLNAETGDQYLLGDGNSSTFNGDDAYLTGDGNTVSGTGGGDVYELGVGNTVVMNTGGGQVVLIGDGNNAGNTAPTAKDMFGFGSNVMVNAANAIAIGAAPRLLANALSNSTTFTLCMGMNTNLCSVIVGDAGGASNYSPLILPGLTPSRPVFTDGNDHLVSGAASITTRQFGIIFDGAGAPLSAQTTCSILDFPATITGVTLTADVSGSATVDVKTVAFASYTGAASASSITASDVPALSSAITYQDTTLTGWGTSLAANTEICFAMTSPSTITKLNVDLKLTAN